MSDLIPVSAVSLRLGISKKRVYQMICEGKLDSLRTSPRGLRVTRASVDQFIKLGIQQEKEELGLSDWKTAKR